MQGKASRILLATGVFVTTLGCASGAEWTTWEQHPAHFASGDHLSFSIANTEGSAPTVTRTDVSRARDEGWWGKVVAVGQEQILDR